jgi:glycosyltransferase involved in cell wall biosynthesis
MKWEDRKYKSFKPETIPGMVSIVMPTFNRPEFLRGRISEISIQKYNNWELIIVNDGGSELSYPSLPNLRYIKLEKNSQSVSIPRNIGISYARGEYICPADDDVEFYPEKLTVLVENIGDKILCYGAREEINLHTKEYRYPPFIENWNPNKGAGVDNGQFIYRKSCYEKLPYVISTHACDYHLARQLYREYGKFNFVHNTVCGYYWHEGNRTHQASRKTVPLDIMSYKEYFNVYNEIEIIRE